MFSMKTHDLQLELTLETQVKRAGFPHYVKVLITICLCLHAVWYVLLMLVVVCLESSTICVHVASCRDGLQLDLLPVTKAFPVLKCHALESKGISQPDKTADINNIWKVWTVYYVLLVSTSILQVGFTKSLIGQNRCKKILWDIYKKKY